MNFANNFNREKTNFLIRLFTLFLFLVFHFHLQAQPNKTSKRPLKEVENPDLQIVKPIFKNPTINANPELLQVRTTSVPPLVGRRFNEAEIVKLLQHYELVLGRVIEYPSNDSLGIIVRQSYAPRQRVRKGTRINIHVGVEEIIIPEREDGNIEMPDYRGILMNDVERMLQSDRLGLESIEERASNEPRGLVLSHFPEVGMIVDPYTQVEFFISAGPELVAVPPLRGKRIDEVATILKEIGLFIGNENIIDTDDPEGIIVNQFPQVGALIPVGSFVDIDYAAKKAEFVMVPDVMGLTVNKAITKIKASNLNYSLDEVFNTNHKTGITFKQQPLPYEEVLVGYNVHILYAGGEDIPPYVPWVAGGIIAVIAGGFIGKRVGKRRKKREVIKKETDLHLQVVDDKGQQILAVDNHEGCCYSIHIQYIPDPGEQNLKNPLI